MSYFLSVDVEDWFQVENLKGVISRDTWDSKQWRLDKNIDMILEALSVHSLYATFFILGWVARRSQRLVHRIHAQGHEIASHGSNHDLIHNLSREAFLKDVEHSKKILEDITGETVFGYRAPNFSITDGAIEVLAKVGFVYDSSFFPTQFNKRYGRLAHRPNRRGRFFEFSNGLIEVPLSCLNLLRLALPWSGGGYFRIMPYIFFKKGVQRIADKQGNYTFYIHPWEFDHEQPRMKGISRQLKFRHYINLDKTMDRFSRLISEFPFEPIKSALKLEPMLKNEPRECNIVEPKDCEL